MNTEDDKISNKNNARLEYYQRKRKKGEAEIAEEREMRIECEHNQRNWAWKLLLNEKNVA
ncbi:26184_t:CDS:2 [Gigaspora margarita]|uniref:26184_t:CDS:1 n=1 Tax=Gigaspora margarita TaxID=4874 RepID=A0ABN7V0X5_GIGMA|nr:26184_t:CDS:2 [Gigaspora margarita]